ncbi:Hypothetical predicted protein [Olea europaea subsp. europaea]|uniref:Uncharacterized protein n=1 Tax=Olea europaea subsp. europaea TaxID=158383 RepID=A0A8S0PAZ0_OLEEU|nr:Hypothetical predicted protein [Olea europaea subsp. europaea]
MEQVNVYLLHVLRKKQRILIHKKLPKKVRTVAILLYFLHIFFLLSLKLTVVSQVTGALRSSAAMLETGYVVRPDSLSAPGNAISGAALSPWTCKVPPAGNVSHMSRDDMRTANFTVTHNYSSSSNESTTRLWPKNESNPQVKEKQNPPTKVMPDFAEVYRFIGSVFDPNASDHMERLKKMDRINVETAVMLMKNLSANLMSPEFEDHRRMFSSYGVGIEKDNFDSPLKNLQVDKVGKAIPTA